MKDNFSIGKKMAIFGVAIFIVLAIVTLIKYNFISEAKKNFNIYTQKAVAGKNLVLYIGKDLNYISRCTRDIMLGNAYDKNIAKIEKSRANIIKSFDDLKQTIVGTPNEKAKLKALEKSKQNTIAFIDDGYNKMKSLANIKRTPEVLADMYQQYKKDATPLANASREAFKKIVNAKNNGLKKRTKMFYKEISSLEKFIFIELVIALTLIIGYLIFLSKNITQSLRNFKDGLDSFFDFMNKKSTNTQAIKVTSNDEFAQMAELVNNNIENIKKQMSQDQTLIDEASQVINKVKNGWFDNTINTSTSNDELNTLKNVVNDMILTIKSHFGEMNMVLEKYANYDYTKELKVDGIEKNSVFDKLIHDINSLKNAVTNMLIENKSNGLTLDKTSDVLLTNVNKLNSNSTIAASALEETAAALEEITGNISNTTSNVIKMSDYASEVTTSVSKGQDLATQTTTAMDEINNEVNAINEAISVIDQISFQTNILSLNAAVEAATAGEAGKGFAVVAQEVRNLASRSAEAANEIKKLVENATLKANGGKKISDEMIGGYSVLNENISKTIELIKDIETASKEQQKGIVQINDAITSLDRQTQENANIASQTHDIAVQTDSIAKLVVSSTNEKKFNGKDLTKRKTPTDLEYNGHEKRKKERVIKTHSQYKQYKNENEKITPVESNKNDEDEWASF